MSDMEAAPTTYSPRVNKHRSRYEALSEAAGLAGAFGDTGRSDRYGAGAAKQLAWLTRHGGNVEGIDVADFSGEFDPTQANLGIGVMAREADRRHPGSRNRTAVGLNNRVSGLLEERGLARRQGEFNDNILPTYTGAMDRLNELAGTAAISAEQEGLLRSKIAATNRTAAASNLGRVSAALGMRGMSNSPAAAALASSVAQDYDVDLMNSLSDMGLKVSEMNREQARQDSGAAASLATLRINAENAYLAKDTEAVQSIGRDTAALIDALYSRDKSFDLMERGLQDQEDQQRKANQMATVGMILGGAKTAMSGYQAFGGGGGDFSTPNSPYSLNGRPVAIGE